MATPSLNLCNRAETGKTRFAQTVPRLFSARLHKFKAPSRAGTSTAKPLGCMRCQALVCCCVLLCFARTPLLGLLAVLRVLSRTYYCVCASMVGRWSPRWRLEFLLQGGKRGEACLSEASLPLLPPCDINSRSLSPSRARLSFAYFSLARQRKVSQPRQGMKQGMDQKKKTIPNPTHQSAGVMSIWQCDECECAASVLWCM